MNERLHVRTFSFKKKMTGFARLLWTPTARHERFNWTDLQFRSKRASSRNLLLPHFPVEIVNEQCLWLCVSSDHQIQPIGRMRDGLDILNLRGYWIAVIPIRETMVCGSRCSFQFVRVDCSRGVEQAICQGLTDFREMGDLAQDIIKTMGILIYMHGMI